MRVVFYLLLIVNAGVFVWYLNRSGQSDAPLVANDPGTEKLQLLDEVRSSPNRSAGNQARVSGKQSGHRRGQPVSGAKSKPLGRRPVAAGNRQHRLAGTQHCLRFGPFAQRGASEGLRQQLDLLGLKAGRLARTEQVTRHYWVLISPIDDRAAARKMVSDMRHAGTQDIQLLYKARRYTISLGLFKRRQIADKRLMDIERLGFKPRIAIQEKRHARYWLVYRMPEGDGLNDKWQTLLAAWPGVRREVVACPAGTPSS